MAILAPPDLASQPKRKGPTPHFPTKPSVAQQALQLWAAALRGLLNARKIGDENVSDTIPMFQRLHAILVEDEGAAYAVMAAVALLPYEHLQTVQVCMPCCRHPA